MIEFSKLEIRQVDGGYLIFDKNLDKLIFEVWIARSEFRPMTKAAQKNRERATIYDVRGGKERLGVMTAERFDIAEVTAFVMHHIESLICVRCRQEWGPVCNNCADEVGDQTFRLFKELERMVDDKHHGKKEAASDTNLPRRRLWST